MATAKNIYKNILKQLQYLPGWGEYMNVSFFTSDYATVVTKRMQSTQNEKSTRYFDTEFGNQQKYTINGNTKYIKNDNRMLRWKKINPEVSSSKK